MYFKTFIILAILGTVFGRIKFHFGTYMIVDPGFYPGIRKVHRYLQRAEFPDIPVYTSPNNMNSAAMELVQNPNTEIKEANMEVPDMPPNSFSAAEILTNSHVNRRNDNEEIPVNISPNNNRIIWQWLGEKEGWRKIIINGNRDWQLVPNGNTSPNTDFHYWNAKNIEEKPNFTGHISPNANFVELELLRNLNARTNTGLLKRQRDDPTRRVKESPGNEEMFENRSFRDQMARNIYRSGHRHSELWSRK